MQAKDKTIKGIRSKQGASEVIGSLLAVAITVVLLSAVILWIISLPPPSQGAKADLSATLDIVSNGGIVKLTHKGGETLKEEETTIFVYVDYQTKAYKISDGIDKNELGIGDTWQVVVPEITKDSQVSIAVKDTKNEEVIMDSVLRGTEIVSEKPNIAYAVCVPDNIPNDGSIPFKVKAYISSVYDIKEVSVDLTVVNGNPSELLTDANQDNIYETNFIYIQSGFAVGDYSFMVKAVDIRENETTANAKLKVYWADNIPPTVAFIKPLNNEIIEKRPIEIIAEYYDEAGGSGIDTSTVKMLVDPGTVGGGDTYYANSGNGEYTVTESIIIWLPYNLEENTYTITVSVKDNAGNLGSGKVFFTVSFSVDLSILDTDIYFSNSHPNIGTTITISAKISNTGGTDIDSAVVEFYDGSSLIGKITLTDIVSNSYQWANITWLASIAGNHTITVKIVDIVPIETITTNNEASKDIYVNRYPVVTFIYPAGGEVVSGTITIIWTIDDDIDDRHTATIQYGIEGTRTTWENIASNIPSTGNHVWDTTTLPDGTHYLLRIIIRDNYGLSGEDITSLRFAIENVPTKPEVLVIAPNGGEIWSGTQNILYRITDPDSGEPITLTVQHNRNGAGWTNIDIFDIIIDWTVGATYDGTYSWDTTTVPDGNYYLIRIIAVDRVFLSGSDMSDDYFAIENVNTAPSVSVISPNGGEVWSGTQTIIYIITDIDAGDIESITIQHNNNDPSGNTWITIGTASLSMRTFGTRTGTLAWDTTTVPDGINYLIKVISVDSVGNIGEDISDDYFAIENVNTAPSVLVVSPNGGEVWSGTQTIIYIITDIDARDIESITIQHNNNRGMSSNLWTTITTLSVYMETYGTLTLTYNWDTTTVPDGTNYLIKVKTVDSKGQIAEDVSDALFSIENVNIAPSITVVVPNGGEVWWGTRTIIYTITDIDAGDIEVIAIQHNRNGAGWETITTTGIYMGTYGTLTLTYAWDTTTVPDGSNYLIRVIATDTRGLQGTDTSNNYFTINNINDAPKVTIIAPVQGDVWSGTRNIRWIATDNDGDILTITIEYSYDNGLTWITIVSGIANTGTYAWDTTTVGYGTTYKIRVKAWDGYQWGEDTSGSFTISNGKTYYFHVESPGGGVPISQWKRLETKSPDQGTTQVVSKSLNVPSGTDVIIDDGQGLTERWITPAVTKTTSLAGTWKFYIWGKVYGGNYYYIWATPFVKVYKYNPSTQTSTFLFRADTYECINYYSSWHQFYFTKSIYSWQGLSLAIGERLYIEVGIKVNSPAGAVMFDFGYDSSAQNSRVVSPVYL